MGRRLPRVLSVDEARRLLAAAASPRDKAIIAIGIYAGLRRAEIAGLDLPDVSLAEGKVYVRRGKGDKDRIVPLHRELASIYAEYLDGVLRDDGPVFGGRDGPRIGLRTIQDIVTRTARRAGVRGTHVHTLRHTCATLVYSATQDLRAVQELLGHASPNTTQVYAHISGARLRATVEAFSLAGPGEERSVVD